jgi:glyoxylase-like metal-dependent hydrolase (beta-lactamase superfamily II)
VLRLVTGSSVAETRTSGARAGRGPVELMLPDVPTVSREHARFTFSDGRWWVSNQGRNGLTLNGAKVTGKQPQPLSDGDTIVFGRATLRAVHVPGHTLGSIALIADEGLALTGDFLFVQSVGRPDLAGKTESWAKLLWQSLERARQSWTGDLLVVPGHYSSEAERRADRAIAARFDVITATNHAGAIQEEREFLKWITDHATTFPDAYRTIKETNLGLSEPADADIEILESGPNHCAVG